MKIGVDSSIIVAGVHANHPLHAVAADWLIRNISENELIIAHHSILEAYAVLIRLPSTLRISGTEAKQLLAPFIDKGGVLATSDHPDGEWSPGSAT